MKLMRVTNRNHSIVKFFSEEIDFELLPEMCNEFMRNSVLNWFLKHIDNMHLFT